MGSWGDDVGLLYLVLLNAAVLVASWRLARRRSADALDAAGDALLLYYFVQYVSVAVPGIIGALHPLTIGLVALLLSALMAMGSWRIRPREAASDEVPREGKGREGASDGRRDTRIPRDVRDTTSSWPDLWLKRRSRIIAGGAIIFVIGYVASLIVHQRNLPVISNDAITYHLPAAVQWLQSGRLGLYEAWYYNPANSYSPLGGSVFLTWLIAPMQSDVIARFVAVGPLLMLLIAMLNLCRRLGVDMGVAALIAAACALSRPFASQAILAKDDLFVAAFFVILLDALSRERLSTRSGPFRVGIALGLLLATKYTVLLSLPILLLMINRAWTWRRIGVAALVALVMAGPWYLRNLRLSGNPLYPSDVMIGGVTIFPGMMQVTRSKLLMTPRGAWEVLAGGYYGITRRIAIVLIAAWVGAVICVIARWRRRRRRRDAVVTTDDATTAADAQVAPSAAPMSRRGIGDLIVRTSILGPVIGLAIFVFAAPYGEMRFAYPSIALLFACIAIAIRALPWTVQVILTIAILLLCAFTAFRAELSWMFVAAGAAAALPAMLITLAPRRTAKRTALALGGVAALLLAMYAYVYFESYVRQAETDSAVSWYAVYGPIADAWQFIRGDGAGGAGGDDADAATNTPSVRGAVAGARIPRGATIAYANTYFTYPLMGYRYDHRVVHVPARRDIENFRELPHLPGKVTGEELVSAIVAELRKDPDRTAWLRRLRESGAQYLIIAKYDPAKPTQPLAAAEMIFAEQNTQHFVRIFDNGAASVFRIAW